ncbi:MAG: hypothetical protein EOO27_27730, partial [Comamonadaceae bacterium]
HASVGAAIRWSQGYGQQIVRTLTFTFPILTNRRHTKVLVFAAGTIRSLERKHVRAVRHIACPPRPRPGHSLRHQDGTTMNRTYRSVWNEALGAWVATSEISRARGKRSSLTVATTMALLTVALTGGGARAQPIGSGIVTGAGIAASSTAVDCATSNYTPSYPYGKAAEAESAGIAIGCASEARGRFTIAIGWGATALMGTDAKRGDGTSIAIGQGAFASNITGDQLAIGASASATGIDSLAIGGQASTKARNSIVLNTGFTTLGIDGPSTGAIAIGSNAGIQLSSGSISIGINSAVSQAPNSVAIGNTAGVIAIPNSVAIGANTSVFSAPVPTPTATINGTVYQYAGGAPAGSVAIGGRAFLGSVDNFRQLKGVAAGQVTDESTDGINGSQLYRTNQALEELAGDAVLYAPGNRNLVTLNPTGTPTTIDNLAPGTLSPTSTQAVNGSQLNTTNANVTNLGNTVNNIDLTGTKYFKATSTLPGAQANGTDSVAIGPNSVAGGSNSVALGNGAQASLDNSVAVGSGSVSAIGADAGSVTLRGNTYQFAGAASATTNTLSVGAPGSERQIKNVAAGVLSTTSTDAVNGSQLFATNEALGGVQGTVGNAVFYNDASKTTVTLNPAGTATTIDNLAPGELSPTSTQAVNGSQLNATNQTITNIAGDTSNTYTGKNGIGIRYVRTNETGLTQSDAFATGRGSTAVGYEAKAAGADSLAIGRNAAVDSSAAVVVGLNTAVIGSPDT